MACNQAGIWCALPLHGFRCKMGEFPTLPLLNFAAFSRNLCLSPLSLSPTCSQPSIPIQSAASLSLSRIIGAANLTLWSGTLSPCLSVSLSLSLSRSLCLFSPPSLSQSLPLPFTLSLSPPPSLYLFLSLLEFESKQERERDRKRERRI